MASAAAEASQRAPAVVSGQGGPPVSEGTIMRSAARTPTPPAPGGASNTPPPPRPRPPSVGSPASSRTTHPAPPADTDSSNASAGNPHRAVRPVLPARGVAPPPPAGSEGGQIVVLALLAYNVTVLIGIIPELGRVVGDLSTAARVAYGVLAMVAAALLPIAFMAAVINHPSVSAFCAKLGAIVCSDLLLVAISTRFGSWGCVAAAPSAAALTCILAALWIRGNNMSLHAVENAASAAWKRIVHLFAPPESPGAT